MKRWMLMCCFHKMIEDPRFFETKEEAFLAMCSDIGKLLDLSVDEVMQARSDDDLIDDEASIFEDHAFLFDGRGGGEWKIFDVDYLI